MRLSYLVRLVWFPTWNLQVDAIKGIGPASQRWFSKSLNVRTYHGLAALSGDQLESRFKTEGRLVSQSEIERWIVQAQELALLSQRAEESVTERTGITVNFSAGEGEWKPFASFVVEFHTREVEGRSEERRTTVHYMEADKSETWPGIEGERLCQWMLGQVGGKLQQEPEEELPVEARPAAAPPVRLEITQIRAFQPPQTETPIGIGKAGGPFQGFIRSGEPFALEVSFALTGSAVADIVKRRTTYSAQFQVRNLITRAKKPLGDTKPAVLVAGKPRKAMLPQSSLQPGLYRLQVLTTLQSTPPIVGYLEVPLLQVV